MKRVGRARTAPEELVALELRKLGIRYRRTPRDLPGSPDFANKARRWAIFVNGCYWHHHEGCARATIPTRNRAFWTAKFADNRKRDRAKIKELRTMGYDVLTLWECQTCSGHLIGRKLQAMLCSSS
jgi:DNA mismatch endonuclease (patch repair protein)